MGTTTAERFVNWPERLNAYITEAREFEWGYGIHDCCTFSAGAVEAMTGIDYMEEFRGKYHDEDTATEALGTIGAGDIYRTIVAKFGKAIPPAQAQRGDLAIYDGCLGIVLGRQSMFIKAEGYGFVGTIHCTRTFKVAR